MFGRVNKNELIFKIKYFCKCNSFPHIIWHCEKNVSPFKIGLISLLLRFNQIIVDVVSSSLPVNNYTNFSPDPTFLFEIGVSVNIYV